MSLEYAANLSLLYTEVPFLERFDRAAASGFKAVEFHFPYDFKIEDVRTRLIDNGLNLVLFNLHAGDEGVKEWGTLSNPGRKDYFRDQGAQDSAYKREIRTRLYQGRKQQARKRAQLKHIQTSKTDSRIKQQTGKDSKRAAETNRYL